MIMQMNVDQVCKTQTNLIARYIVNEDNSIELVQVLQNGKSKKVGLTVTEVLTSIIENQVRK